MNSFRSFFKPLMWSMALLLGAFVAGCGSDNKNPGGGGAGAGPVGTVCTGAACVPLGTAANYAILAETGVATVPTSVVNGNVGLSPAARTFLTGWSLITEPTDTYFTSAQVVAPGKLYAADNVGGTTSADLGVAVLDMQTAYTAAVNKTSTAGCPGVGVFDGGTVPPLAPGVYTCAVNVTIPANFTLNGSATDVWVFQITGTVDQAAATQVLLTGGALPKNVFWQVSGAVTIGANSLMQGIVLGQTAINFGNLAAINGRLLAQTAVNLNATTVTLP